MSAAHHLLVDTHSTHQMPQDTGNGRANVIKSDICGLWQRKKKRRAAFSEHQSGADG